MEETQIANQLGRDDFIAWKEKIKQNIYTYDLDFQHTIQFHLGNEFKKFNEELDAFGKVVVEKIEPLVNENNLAINLPRLEQYDEVGSRVDKVIHHPSYVAAGDLIYHSRLLEKMAKPGGLFECLSLLFLSSHAGEAGHNCPIACSAGIIRVLQKIQNVEKRDLYLEQLTKPSFQTNYTGAQFLTEIQGGSDVGLNAVYAKQENNQWRIYGEKWFCSNAGADLIFLTARYDQAISGTKGLSLFLVPAKWENKKNSYTIRRLKEKIGTRSMATGEIDFHGAYAIPVGTIDEGFHLVMDNVLHLSRMFNTICVLGMARRAYMIALEYAKHRKTFSHEIIHYPLVQENLAKVKAENAAMTAAIFYTIRLQDTLDKENPNDKAKKLLLRLLVNFQKYLSALWSVEHVHHCLDVLAGNGTIENFSPIPRLLRDCIVCENWEGTHNVLRMQILKDILKYNIDAIFLKFIREQLNAIKNKEEIVELEILIKELEEDIIRFRKLDARAQALKIKSIVDKMAIIFCAIQLLIEAIDQKNTNGSESKLNCYLYFSELHLNKEKIKNEDEYIKLIDKIVS